MFKELFLTIRSDGHKFRIPQPKELVRDKSGVIFNYHNTLLGRMGELLTNITLWKFGASATHIEASPTLPYTNLEQEYPETVVIRTIKNEPASPIRTAHDPRLTEKIRMSEDVK